MATVVDWDLLLQAASVSVAVGLGVLIVGAIAVASSLRADDARRVGATAGAAVYSAGHRGLRARAGRRGGDGDLSPHAVSGSDKPFDAGRPRPIPTVLDTLRARLDLDAVDAVAFSLESVVADLGYGDLRPLPGSVAWIDRLRADGKRTALMFSGENAAAALRLAGIDDRFDAVLSGPRTPETVREALAAVGAAPERAIVVDVLPDGLVAAREAGCRLTVAVARGPATPEALRQERRRGDRRRPAGAARAGLRDTSPMGGDAFLDDFDGPDLDTEVWVPQYLPMWSSRAESAATYAVAESELRLSIPPDQGLWCAGDHEPPLRVSGIQSGVWSGPVGGTRGQQPFRDGAVVREFQPPAGAGRRATGSSRCARGWTSSPRSMASAWMVGREEEPTECGEICLVEVFGDAIETAGGTRERGRRHGRASVPRPRADGRLRRPSAAHRRR